MAPTGGSQHVARSNTYRALVCHRIAIQVRNRQVQFGMSHTRITGVDLPARGEQIILTFPNSKSGAVRTSVLEHLAQPRPGLLLAAPLLDGEVTVVAKGEAILMQWQSKSRMHSLPGIFHSLVDSGVAAWRVDVGQDERAEAVAQSDPVEEDESVEAINRRRHVRVPMRGRADVVSGGRKLRVETLDISESGVRCRWAGDRFWAPSRASSVIVSLAIGAGRPVTLTGSVVWVRRGDQGVEFSVAFTHLDESPKTIQLLRRYVVALDRNQLLRSQSQ
jgi:hypothetical protein